MSPRSRREYLEVLVLRYRTADRTRKSRILDEFCATCGHHRKHAIRLLRSFRRFTAPTPQQRGRKPCYNSPALLTPLKKIWLEANLPCSKRLKALLPLWLPGYEALWGRLPSAIHRALLRLSPATIDRALQPTRLAYARRGRCATKPGSLLRSQIPIGTNQWEQARPGFLEADTVAHCGPSLAGQLLYTLDCVDLATGWTAQRAVWGRGETAVLAPLRDIEASLPFALLGFDCDNGSEFLNHHLVRHFLQRPRPVTFTRSRPYRKDDNTHIEQKTRTHVRQWLGYARLDNPASVPLLNALYSTEWRLYHNFFCPSAKLVAKQQLGSKTLTRYDRPQTPAGRVLASPAIPEATQRALTQPLHSLNPFLLRRAMELTLRTLFQTCYTSPPARQRPVPPLR